MHYAAAHCVRDGGLHFPTAHTHTGDAINHKLIMCWGKKCVAAKYISPLWLKKKSRQFSFTAVENVLKKYFFSTCPFMKYFIIKLQFADAHQTYRAAQCTHLSRCVRVKSQLIRALFVRSNSV